MRQTNDLTASDELAVVALAIIGDQRAFAELVRRRQSWLRNLMRRLSGDYQLADDLSQQVFLQAWRGISSLQASAAFGGWLKKLAVNTWLQHLRKCDPLDASHIYDDELSEPSGIEAHGERIDLDHALAALPDQVRLCIVLSYNEGMSHGMIAEVTRLPLGTVKSHIKRGTQQLRQLLGVYGDDFN